MRRRPSSQHRDGYMLTYNENDKTQFRAAKANWDAFNLPMDAVREAATDGHAYVL